MPSQPLRVGVGGPVGSGKTALVEALCKTLRDRYQIAVVTNDIYTYEDAQFLTRAQALEAERIVGVETGGCPHTAIREEMCIRDSGLAALFTRSCVGSNDRGIGSHGQRRASAVRTGSGRLRRRPSRPRTRPLTPPPCPACCNCAVRLYRSALTPIRKV